MHPDVALREDSRGRGHALQLGPGMSTGIPDAVDISDNNGPNPNWAQVASDGVKVGIAKCSEANGGIHPGFAVNWPSLLANVNAGRLQRRGTYNFCQPGDGVSEARSACGIVKSVGGFSHPDDFIAMDCERAGETPDFAYAALMEATQQSQRLAWLYASYGFLMGNLHADPRLKQFPLWVADINPTLPSLPWAHALWQNGWTYHVPGIASAVDGSLFGPTYASTLHSGTGSTPLPGVESDDENMIAIQWKKPSVADRIPTALLDKVNKCVWLFDGAAIAYDQPTHDPNVRCWKIGASPRYPNGAPLNGAVQGMAELRDSLGTKVTGCVVLVADHGTFVGNFS